jgi:membrane protein DedA with SNARE-associated domain
VERHLIFWIAQYGPPVLFFAQVLGIVGLPIPDELLLTVAGALVRKGVLNRESTISAAIAGCLTGITLSYAIGRAVGYTVLRATGPHRRQFERGQDWFRRFGVWPLTFGYFIPGVRHVTAIAAGSGGLGYWTFASYAYPGGVLWCGVFLAIGYYAGDRWREVAQTTRSHLSIAACVVICAVIAFALVRVWAERGRVRGLLPDSGPDARGAVRRDSHSSR